MAYGIRPLASNSMPGFTKWSPLWEAARLLTEGRPPEPVLIKHCSECSFEASCRKKVTGKDDLSLLRGLGTTTALNLTRKGYSPLLNWRTPFAHAADPSIRHRAENDITMLSKLWQFETGRFTSLGRRSLQSVELRSI